MVSDFSTTIQRDQGPRETDNSIKHRYQQEEEAYEKLKELRKLSQLLSLKKTSIEPKTPNLPEKKSKHDASSHAT